MDTTSGTMMARSSFRVRDVLKDPKQLWQLLKDSVSAWIDDFAPSMGAAISYYTVFSIAPLLLIVIAVAGLVLGQEAASGQIFAQLQGLLGEEGATAVQGMVESASLSGKSFIATVIGVVTLVIGATTVFSELQSALDRIWESPAAEKQEGIWNLLRSRVLSFGMILAIGFLLLVSLVVSAGLSALGSWWGPMFGGWEILLQVVNFVVSLVVVTALFALLQIPAARENRMARRVDRCGRDGTAFHPWKISDRSVHRKEQRRLRLRCSGLARRRAGVGLLLRPDLFARSGIHLGVRVPAWIAPRRDESRSRCRGTSRCSHEGRRGRCQR